jgi:photosystem II stability/assembly factor-like uncharacterized protein
MCLLNFNGQIFAGTKLGIYSSMDNGISWVEHSFAGRKISTLCSLGKRLIASVGDEAVYYSDDTGKTWTKALTFTESLVVTSSASDDRYVFIGTNSGLYRSEDNAKTWSKIAFNDIFIRLFFHNSNLFASTVVSDLCKTSTYGDKWSVKILPSRFTLSFMTKQGSLFVGTGIGIYRSDDNGDSWREFGLQNTNKIIQSMLQVDDKIFVGTQAGLYISGDNGKSWQEIPELFGRNISSFVKSNTGIILGTLEGDVYLVSALQTPTTNARSISMETTPSLSVAPNPMRENGHIRYSIPQAAHVRISLVSTLGQIVEVLHDAPKSAGEYSLLLDASHYPAGVYMVRIEAGAGARTEQGKLVIVP